MSVATEASLMLASSSILRTRLTVRVLPSTKPGSVPGQVTQFALPAWQNKAAFQQPVLQQLRDPLAVHHVALPPGHVLQALRIHQQDDKAALQDVVDRFPVHAGRLRRHVGNALGGHPVSHRQQIRGHRSPAACDLMQPVAGFHPAHAGFDRLLVHIQTRTARENVLHRRLPSPLRRRTSKVKQSALRALNDARRRFGVRSDVQARLTSGLAPRNPGLLPEQSLHSSEAREHFHSLRVPQSGMPTHNNRIMQMEWKLA